MQKPRLNTKAPQMKITEILSRRKRSQRRLEQVELPRDWSVREWADLPTHHPSRR